MEFTLHNSYVIPEPVPSTVFFSGQSSAADANKAMLSKVEVIAKKLYSRRHNLVDRYEISISQMTMDLLLFS
jgi:hypothetical protein